MRNAMSVTDTTYQATRVTYDSARGFAETQCSFDEHVPLLDPGVAIDLVISGGMQAFLSVNLPVATTLHRNLPDDCK